MVKQNYPIISKAWTFPIIRSENNIEGIFVFKKASLKGITVGLFYYLSNAELMTSENLPSLNIF